MLVLHIHGVQMYGLSCSIHQGTSLLLIATSLPDIQGYEPSMIFEIKFWLESRMDWELFIYTSSSLECKLNDYLVIQRSIILTKYFSMIVFNDIYALYPFWDHLQNISAHNLFNALRSFSLIMEAAFRHQVEVGVAGPCVNSPQAQQQVQSAESLVLKRLRERKVGSSLVSRCCRKPRVPLLRHTVLASRASGCLLGHPNP